MPYFRELPLKTILIRNFVLGLLTGWFFVQGIKLALGLCVFGGLQMTMIFWRFLGVQLSVLVFIIVFAIEFFYWKKHRTDTPKAKPTAKEYGMLALTVIVYGVGLGLINLIRLI